VQYVQKRIAAKVSPDYLHLLVGNLNVCLVMLLGETFFIGFAVPRFPDLTIIFTAAFRAWTVVIITIAIVWFFQGWRLKLPTKINLLFTGMDALIGLTYLLYTTYHLCERYRF
jgi:hypothetical protein